MKVSVVIPTYNQPELVRATVEAALSQSRPPDECIVVDDGSDRDTRGALEPLLQSIRYVRKENGGPASAKNVGIAAATGDLIAFCDHDDLWLPEKLERHVARHESDRELGVTYSRVNRVLPDGRVRRVDPRQGPEGMVFAALLRKSFIPTCSAVVVRREALDDVGPFDEGFRLSDDYDLWFRLARRFRFGFIEDSLVQYRLYEGNASRDNRLLHEEKVQVFERLLEGPEAISRTESRLVKRKIARHLVGAAKNHLREGEARAAGLLFRRAAALAPLSLRLQRYRLQSFVRGLFDHGG